MKVIFPELYLKAKLGSLSYAEVKQALGLRTSKEGEEEGSRIEWAAKWWRFCADKELDGDSIAYHARDIARYHFDDRFEIVPFTANEIIDRLIPRAPSG